MCLGWVEGGDGGLRAVILDDAEGVAVCAVVEEIGL